MSHNTKNSISLKWKIVLNMLFSVYTLLCIVPLLLVTIVSITDERELLINGYGFFPSKLSLSSYAFIFTNMNSIFRSYGVTIFATVVGSLSSMLIIAAFAYPISRKDFKYKNFFSFLVFFSILFNGGMVPWYLVCTQLLHLKNQIWALIVPYLMNGFYVLVMRTFYKSTIPDSLIESANMEGAGEMKIFTAIILPLSKPGLATIGLFSTLGFWNDFYLPLMLIDDNRWINIQYALYRIQSNIQYLTTMSAVNGNLGGSLADLPAESARMAMCVLAVGPIVFAYPFFQRFFVKGLVIGAVKG